MEEEIASDTPTPASALPLEAKSPASPTIWLRHLAYATVITAIWFAMSLWGLGKAPFHTKGEPREALVVWEMPHGGGWILPMRNGEELPSKPPLFHWLGAATSLLRGSVDEWSIRFPSAALSLLSLWCVFAAGSALWTAEAGLLSALVLMTTFEWARAATNARVDMSLTFGLQAAFLCLLFFLRTRSPRWLTPLYVGIALAVLGKGFVGAVLPGLVALTMILLLRDWQLLIDLRLVRGACIVLAIAGLWYVLALFVGGMSFFHKQILGEQLFTFVDNPDFGWTGHRHSLAYLPGTLLLGLLPWTPFFVPTAVALWQKRRELTVGDTRLYLLVWIVVVFAFYELASHKRSVYLLALYPAAALLLGSWWHEQLGRRDRFAWMAKATVLLATLLLVILIPLTLALFLEALGLSWLSWLTPRLSRSAQFALPGIAAAVDADGVLLAALLLLGLGALYALRRGARQHDWGVMFVGLLVATVALQALVRVVFLPGLAHHQTFAAMMREVRAVVGPQSPLHFYKAFEYGAVFYSEGHIPQYQGAWPEQGPRFVLIKPSTWEAERATTEVVYEKVALKSSLEGKSKDALILLRRKETAATP